MYPNYFGLKEPSFSIAPDPQYLFLSEQHREALAHLLYGAGENGGFVLLTGEVGTGKTTVCRAFLEQLPEGVDVALILNPAQSANELLTNICEEFRIPLPKGKPSNKMLIDRLNAYLLAAHAEGRRPVLIIDEAQNLLPQSLEQIRLLTNLETTKHKLLQIFLIGQPELRQLLARDRLRQLDQRITARFHLRPLTRQETGDYIRHRVAVAGVDRPLFSGGALRRIYRVSGGIPRLVNILCDRALLGTCVTRASQVTTAIVATAAREVRGEALDETGRARLSPGLIGTLSLVLAIGLAVGASLWVGFDPARVVAEILGQGASDARSPEQSVEETSVVPWTPLIESGLAPRGEDVPVDVAEAPETADLVDGDNPVTVDLSNEPAAEPGTELASSVSAIVRSAEVPLEPVVDPDALADMALSEADAMRFLLRRWGLELTTLGIGPPCERILTFGLTCERERGRLSHVRFFDLPVVLTVRGANGEVGYLALGALGTDQAVLELPEGHREVTVEALESIWTGEYTLVWKLPPGGTRAIGLGITNDDVRWLRGQLAKLPGLILANVDSSVFDAELAEGLRAFQSDKGLVADGIAGPRTLMVLQHSVALPGVPSLAAQPAQAAVSGEQP